MEGKILPPPTVNCGYLLSIGIIVPHALFRQSDSSVLMSEFPFVNKLCVIVSLDLIVIFVQLQSNFSEPTKMFKSEIGGHPTKLRPCTQQSAASYS